RDGADLYCRVPISMTTAALGGSVEVPTLDNNMVRVKIPEGTESGQTFRLRSKGMPVLRSSATGDLNIQVEVETPKNLNRKQKDLLKQFEDASTEKTSPESSSFFSKMRSFFDAGDA
ncbi:MAG: DnaJ C-terminal domain-containing protein, partial [Pseudomonadota bacterium]